MKATCKVLYLALGAALFTYGIMGFKAHGEVQERISKVRESKCEAEKTQSGRAIHINWDELKCNYSVVLELKK